jgi:hypothetical protein
MTPTAIPSPYSGGRGYAPDPNLKKEKKKKRPTDFSVVCLSPSSVFLSFCLSPVSSSIAQDNAALASEIDRAKLFTTCKFCMIFVALIPVVNYNAQIAFKRG